MLGWYHGTKYKNNFHLFSSAGYFRLGASVPDFFTGLGMSIVSNAPSKKMSVVVPTDGPAPPTALYIGHIPHGFFEEEMKGGFYFHVSFRGVTVVNLLFDLEFKL